MTFDPTPPAGRVALDDGSGLADFASDLYATARRLWDDHLIGIDLDDQLQYLIGLSTWLGEVLPDDPTALAAVGLALAVAGGGVLALRRLRFGPRERRTVRRAERAAVPAFYRRVLGRLARRGFDRRPGETPRELAHRAVQSLAPCEAEAVVELTELYYRTRFDPSASSAELRRRARRLLRLC
jgi:hypothetical protein